MPGSLFWYGSEAHWGAQKVTATDTTLTFDFYTTDGTRQDTRTLTAATGDPDATIHKQVDKTIAVPGETLNYSINNIGYAGNDLLTNVTVADTIPTGATYVADSDTPEATETAGLLTWNLGSNTAGTPGTVTDSGPTPAADSTYTTGTAASASSITFSHTPGPNANRLLMVGVSWSGAGTAQTISSVTFGGTALTSAGTTSTAATGRLRSITCWPRPLRRPPTWWSPSPAS